MTHPPIAITGMACLFPKTQNLEGYWRNILDATDCISDVPSNHSWDPKDHHSTDPAAKDKTWCTRGGFLDKVPFDPMEFGIPPNMLESIDTTQLLSLIVARQALIDAGMHPDEDHWDRERVACILGITGTQEMAVNLGARLFGPVWRKALERCGVDPRVADAVVQDIGAHLPTWTEQSFPGLLGNVVTGRITNRFGLGGTNAVVDAACASSLAAIQYGLSDLITGRSDVVITGGADTLNDTFMYQCFSRTPAFTKKGDATPFDAKSDGILIGEGIAMIVAKRLEDAERDGDRIYAVLKGLGSSSDGRFKSIYAPNPDGQAKCLRRAYESADVDPRTIELIEAHGTGTVAGDAAEIAGLKKVFGDTAEHGRHIQLGTVKSQIGHTKSTAGAAGLLKAALALYHRVLPPTAKVETPNPKMNLEESPFFLSPHARPWIRARDHKRRAGVSAFGFGGTNFHAVLEEYGDADTVAPMGPARGELLLFEAADARALTAQLQQLPDGPTFSHVARALQESFTGQQPHVVAFACAEHELAETLSAARARITKGAGSTGDVHYGVNPTPGKLGFVFPGQGSQYVEMGRDLAVRWPIVRAALDAADEHFHQAGRARLSTITFPPPYEDADAHEARLRATEWAQPAIGAFSKGLLDLLVAFGLEPDAVAGHSYGELVALHAAGSIDAEALLTASRVRGTCMGGSGDRGTMAAVSGSLSAIEAAIVGQDVVLANRNHPEQGVISGSRSAIEAAITALEAKGLSAKRLNVSAAFHSPLIADAAEPFASALAELPFRKPRVPVYANANAQAYPRTGKAVRSQLAAQITSPVDWVGIVDAMIHDGVRTFVEVGPKGVLSTLIRKCTAGRTDITVVSLDRHRHRVDGDIQLKSALAQLAAAGVPLDLQPLFDQLLPPAPMVGKSKATVELAGANHRFEDTLHPPVTNAIRAAREIQAHRAAPPSPRAPNASPAMRTQPNPTPTAPVVQDAPMNPDLTALLQSTRDTLLAFQSTQERTAAVHQQFLEAHTQANASFTTLFNTHARLVELATTGQTSIPATAMPARPALAAAVATPSLRAPTRPPIQLPAPTPPAAAGLKSAMTTEAAALVGSFLGQGVKTPATPSLPGLGSINTSTELPPLMDASSKGFSPAPKAPVSAPRRAGPDVVGAMFAAVAEKTGYPEDMLELAMDLEADLGIDSIKRVEILSAVQERVPELPELDNDRLSALRTLQEVTDYLAEAAGVSATPMQASPTVAPTRGGPDVVGAMFAAVAEKTGYPEDMLELAMDLEADLGIDSIKRVEILSAVQERIPELPELDNDRLSALRTLQEVTDYLAEAAGVSAAPMQAAPVSTAPVATNGTGPDVVGAMFAAVAEKTGYPEDMLELAMDLEADLGIDSIKRVEILSAVQERVPELPELDNDRLSALRTLKEVTDYLAEAAGLSAPTTPATAKMEAATEGTPPFSLIRKTVRLVACGPGTEALPSGRVIVTQDKSGRAEPLVELLRARGIDAQLLDPDWSTSFELSGVSGVIHLAAVGARGDDLHERVRGAFTLAHATGEIPFFATVSELGGDFGLASCKRPTAGGLAGMPKTLSREWSGRYTALDIDSKTSNEALCDALLTDFDALEIGVTPAGVFHLHNAVSERPPAQSSPCKPGDLVVVSGGARGVTAQVVLEMAKRYQPTLLLLGRSPLVDEPTWAHGVVGDGDLQGAWIAAARARGEKPSPRAMNADLSKVRAGREVRSNLKAMLSAGSEVHYASLDIRDADAVAAAIAPLGKPVVGIVHGAGVLADKLVVAKTPEMFERVWSTKVDGLDALLEATDEHLGFALFFASVAGRYGNIGQCDYAMANEVLTHTALQLSQRGVRAKSLAWGPWDGGMVTPALAKQFAARGISTIPLLDGARFACDELECDGPIEVVVEGPRPQNGTLKRVVSVATHPYLLDHSIDATPVIPVAMVLEWFADAASQIFPALHVSTVEELAVLKGLMLDGPTELELSWETLEAHTQGARVRFLLAAEGRPRYRGIVQLSTTPSAAPHFPGSNGLGKHSFIPEPYGKWLFHGPSLQGIQQVTGYSDHGIVGTLASSTPTTLGLGGTTWTTDPLTIDSALQLMLLWVGETQGSRALPCAIGSYQQFKPFHGPIACHLQMHNADARTGRFQATFVDQGGQVVAQLDGGEYAARS